MKDDPFIDDAIAQARDTKLLRIGTDLLTDSQRAFASVFGNRAGVIVADANTFRLAAPIIESFRSANHALIDPFVFSESKLIAKHEHVVRLEAFLSSTDAMPIAVGSGTINDLTKLASHRLNRPYMCVATAASMDGYTAYGASITLDGSKQTFDCPAPRAVLADLDVIAGAPAEMSAWGYADLLAKITCGADWIVADELGVELIDSRAWGLVQDRLRDWLGKPADIKRGDPAAIRGLVCGLMMSGFAMQSMNSSRPASGAEHQFSHLWDMEHATNASHGQKVGVATVAVARLYEAILKQPLETIDVEATISGWPSIDEVEAQIDELFIRDTSLWPMPGGVHGPEARVSGAAIASKAKLETRAKYPARDELRQQLHCVRERWPRLKSRLEKHLPGSSQLVRMLNDVGAPTRPEQIGISQERLRASVRRAYHIRRRFTVLDLAVRTGLRDACILSLSD